MPFLIPLILVAASAVASDLPVVPVGGRAIAVPPPRVTATIDGEDVEMRIVTFVVKDGMLIMHYGHPSDPEVKVAKPQ